jgi:hypothetical protein
VWLKWFNFSAVMAVKPGREPLAFTDHC